MANFDAQITDLIGGTIDQTACDQWAADACRQIIKSLPNELADRCVKVATLDNSATTMDLDTKGEIRYVTRMSADSGGFQIPCRKIEASSAGRVEDSSDIMNYATASDPVFYIDSSSNAATLYVKPTTTSQQTAKVYYIAYPTVDVSGVDTIANFPDEAEYLVVLYVATKQLLQYQSTMSSSFNSDITTAFTAVNTELDETQAICDLINTQVDSAVTALSNMATEIANANAEVDLANPEVDLAKAEIVECQTNIDSAVDTAVTAVKTAADLINAEVDLAKDKIGIEDVELSSGYLQVAQGYGQEVSGHMQEVQARINQINGQIAVANGFLSTASGYNQAGAAYLQVAASYGSQASGFLNAAQGYANEIAQKVGIANAYIAEAGARLASDNAKYGWYSDQFTKYQAEYNVGLTALKGGG